MLSEAALEQRLRRKCRDGAKKKAQGGPEAVTLYADPENRPMLMDMLVKSKFAQAWCLSSCFGAFMHGSPRDLSSVQSRSMSSRRRANWRSKSLAGTLKLPWQLC